MLCSWSSSMTPVIVQLVVILSSILTWQAHAQTNRFKVVRKVVIETQVEDVETAECQDADPDRWTKLRYLKFEKI